jgi:hypothetical protein
MNKNGIIYRHIAETLLKNRKEKFTERGIARSMKISPNTVSYAIAPLKKIGAVQVYRTYFEIANFKKLLLFWSVNRKFDKDIVYSTYLGIKEVSEIENHLPNEIAYTNFSGYTKLFGNDAAAYGEVYVYAAEKSLTEIKERFGIQKDREGSSYKNLIVLKPDTILEERILKRELIHSTVSLPQLYVDLWNNNTWNANTFITKLEKRIDDIYAKAILE